MFEELTKKSFKKCLFAAIVFLIIGIVLVAFSALNVYYTVFGYVDFSQLEPDQIRNQLVELDVTVNFGCFAEDYEENTKTHAKKTTNLWYVIWTGDQNTEDYRYMAIKLPTSYEKRMDDMTEMTYEGYHSSPIHFIGKIRKMDSKAYALFEDYFTDGADGWTKEEFEASTLPYYIDYYHDSISMGVIYGLMFVGGVALIVIGVLRIIKGKTGGYLKKLREDIRISGYSESYIVSDYASSQNITKNDDVKMGRLMTYYHLGPNYRAIPHNKVMWAYQNTTTHRTNGIQTGTTYSVTYYVDGYKQNFTINVPSEPAAQDILRRLNTTCPWVVVGYSEELKKLYNNNRAEFLQLRYNTMAHEPAEPGFENNYAQPNGDRPM